MISPRSLAWALDGHEYRMSVEEFPFGFTEPWHTLGIVTPDQLEALRAEWARGDDRHPEHYRWRAFLAFVAERRPLTPDTAAALYDLGAADADRSMGEAMMHRVVELPECPAEVLAKAAASGIRHLAQAVERRPAAI